MVVSLSISNSDDMSIRSFIFKGIIFICLIFCVDRLVGRGLKWLYDNQKDEEYYYASEAMERQTCDIVVLGSSRARNHYNPEIIYDSLGMSCFNAGRSGYFLMYQSAQLHVMLSRYTPRWIILDIVPYDFTGGQNYDRLSVLLPYKSHKEIPRFLKMRSKYETWKCFSEIYPYNSMFLKLLPNLKNRGVFNSNGFEPLQGYYQGEKTIIDNDSDKTDTDKVDEFERIIKLCKERGVRLTVVTSPFYAYYKKPTSTILIVKQICDKEGVEYINFLNNKNFDNIRLFHSLDHLNAKGADLFTKKLVQILKK